MRVTIVTVVVLVGIPTLVCPASAGSGFGQWPSTHMGHWGVPGGQLGSWGGTSGYYGQKRWPIHRQRPTGSYYGSRNKGFDMNWPTSFKNSQNWNQGIWQFTPGNSGPWSQRSVYPWMQDGKYQWGRHGTQFWGQGMNNAGMSWPSYPWSGQSWNSLAPAPQLHKQQFNNQPWLSPVSGIVRTH